MRHGKELLESLALAGKLPDKPPKGGTPTAHFRPRQPARDDSLGGLRNLV